MQIIGAGTHAPVHKQLKAKRLVDLKVDVVESGQLHALRADRGADRDAARARTCRAEDDRRLPDPRGQRGYMIEELKEAGLLTPEWMALEGKIVENLTLVGATGSAAVPLALDHAWQDRRGQAGRPRDAAGDRDEQVEVRGQRAALDGRGSACRVGGLGELLALRGVWVDRERSSAGRIRAQANDRVGALMGVGYETVAIRHFRSPPPTAEWSNRPRETDSLPYARRSPAPGAASQAAAPC